MNWLFEISSKPLAVSSNFLQTDDISLLEVLRAIIARTGSLYLLVLMQPSSPINEQSSTFCFGLWGKTLWLVCLSTFLFLYEIASKMWLHGRKVLLLSLDLTYLDTWWATICFIESTALARSVLTLLIGKALVSSAVSSSALCDESAARPPLDRPT